VTSPRRVLYAPEVTEVYVVRADRVDGQSASRGEKGGREESSADRAARREAAAYEKGLNEGMQQGLEAGRAEAQQASEQKFGEAVCALAAALDQLHRRRETLVPQAETEAARLALAIASKVICRECATSPDVVRLVAHQALKRVAPREVIAVRVNPQDKQEIEQRCIGALPDDGHHIEVVGDTAITPGGCVVETQLGTVDATIEAQWRQIAEELLEERDERQND